LAVGEKDTVIVIGSAGYIGSKLVLALADKYQVIGFDLETPPHPPPNSEWVRVDLTSDDSVEAAFARVRTGYGKRIASVVHLAAYFNLSGEEDPRYDAVTVEGTRRLLKALQGFEADQFIFASTMLVHAPGTPGQPITEDWPLDPKLPYQASKARTEAAIHEDRGNIPTVTLRPAGVYDDMCHSAFLSQQIARIYEKELISHVYPGDLDTGQPFLHLDDLTDAVQRTIERRAALPPEVPILLGESRTLTFRQLQDRIGHLLHGEDWQTVSIPKPLARTGVWVENEVLDEDAFIQPWMVDTSDDHYELDISRAKEVLGWQPRQFVGERLPVMIEALKADPAGWYKANGLNPARITDQAVTQDEAHEEADPVAHHRMMHEHDAEMALMHLDMLWVHFLNMLLGLWLATSPFVFDTFDPPAFSDAVMRVTEDRGLWDPALGAGKNAGGDR
jgi:nucleoside-diphosphate-sugar epimerase